MHSNAVQALAGGIITALKTWTTLTAMVNPFGAVGKYIYYLFFVKFLGLEGKRNPKYSSCLSISIGLNCSVPKPL